MRSTKRYEGRAQCGVKYAAGWFLVNSGTKAGSMTCMWDATSVTDWGKWGLYLEYGAFGGGKMGRLEKIVMQLPGGAIVNVPDSQGSRDRMALRLQNDPSRKTTVTVDYADYIRLNGEESTELYGVTIQNTGGWAGQVSARWSSDLGTMVGVWGAGQRVPEQTWQAVHSGRRMTIKNERPDQIGQYSGEVIIDIRIQ